jgi:hypothetical protein
MHEINEKRKRLGEYHRLCVSRVLRVTCIVQEHFFNNFSVNSSAIAYCQPGKSVSKTQMSAALRDLDCSAASARPLFDGDDAVLHNNFERLPAAGTDRCPPRQAAFSVGEP